MENPANNLLRPDSEASEQKLKSRRLVKYVGTAVIFLVIGIGLLTPRTLERTIGDQRILDFKPPFFFFSIGDSRCVVNYKNQHGQQGEEQLLYTFMESPVIFLSLPTNENVIFCLYDFDTHYVLLRINTSKPYSLPGSKGDVGFIVLKSSWAVDEGSLDDWRQTFNLIKEMPLAKFKHQSLPARDFGVFKQHFNKEDVLREIGRQIKQREDANSGSAPWRLN